VYRNLEGVWPSTIRAYRNSPTLFRTESSPIAYTGLLFPKIEGSQPHPKLQPLLSQERTNR